MIFGTLYIVIVLASKSMHRFLPLLILDLTYRILQFISIAENDAFSVTRHCQVSKHMPFNKDNILIKIASAEGKQCMKVVERIFK